MTEDPQNPEYSVDEHVRFVAAGFGRMRRAEVALRIGASYVVDALNPQKRRNKGRRCTLISFCDERRDGCVRVRFEDTHRLGLVGSDELVPIRGGGADRLSEPSTVVDLDDEPRA